MGRGGVLEEVEFKEALVIVEKGLRPCLQFTYEPQREVFAIHSQGANGDWVCHCTGRMRLLQREGGRLAIADISSRLEEEISRKDFYKALRDNGLELGTAFQGFVSIRRGGNEALAEVEVPEVAGGNHGYRWHPVALDPCFQVLAAAPGADQSQMLLMAGVRRMRVHGAPAKRMCAWLMWTGLCCWN